MQDVRTPGKLTFHADGDANHYSIIDAEGQWLLSLLHNGRQVVARQEANFRRLAACWNACEGVSTDELENDSHLTPLSNHLRSVGYVVGDRDPMLKPEFPGKFMVRDSMDDEDGFCVVGDNLLELILETFTHVNTTTTA